MRGSTIAEADYLYFLKKQRIQKMHAKKKKEPGAI
jgi:hypothetical protein